MASLKDRELDLETMLGQVEQVVKRGKPGDSPAFTLILGAGASFGVVPTARQMLGLADHDGIHADCIPAYLHEREHGSTPAANSMKDCVGVFWERIKKLNDGRCSLKFDGSGLPETGSVADAYRFLFAQDRLGGLNGPGDARDYLRRVTMGEAGRIRLNGTHFFLGSLLSLQNRRSGEKDTLGRSLYAGQRPFARTIFTTNFDPLLQVSLQLFQNLYYMTDRPELLAADGLHTDDHSALHLFYAHGSVHRPFLANTDREIELLREANHRALAPYFATHGVIVLGYSGWDDCLLRALQAANSFRNNLYWLARGEASITPAVEGFLTKSTNARWVGITDGGEFMAALHRRLCPGMAMTELLANPLAPLRERLGRVDLTGIAAAPMDASGRNTASAEKGSTPEELRQKVVELLKQMEPQFTGIAEGDNPRLKVQKLELQADLAYSNDDWQKALSLYSQVADQPAASVETKAKAYFRRGFCHGQAGRNDEEIADYTRAIELAGAPTEIVAKALGNRGVCHGQAGRNNEEIADYTRAIELPGAPADQVAKALYNRGVCHGQAGRNNEAIADYTRAIELPSAPAEQVAKALYNRGVCHGQASRNNEAIADYTRAIELPSAPAEQVAKALYNRGVCHGQASRNNEAIADYTRAIELPSAPAEQVAKALNNRGVRHGQASRNDEEIADYTRAIELSGAPAEQVAKAFVNRGICYGEAGRNDEAIADYTRAIELSGAPAEQVAKALNNRGVRHGQASRNDEEIADYTSAIELPGAPAEQVAKALYNRGVCHGQAGRNNKAIADYTRAIELPGAPAEALIAARKLLALLKPPPPE